MADQQFGLTSTGFIPMQQSDVISDLETRAQSTFGQNVNLAARAIIGLFIGVFSYPLALLWSLGETIYNMQTVQGAEGTSVDNILALNNLKRLNATATVTEPDAVTQSNGLILYGMVVAGTPGTAIAQGSTVQTSASPPVQFTLDAAVTIGAAVDCVQSLFFSITPTSGAYTLSFTEGPVLAGNPYSGSVLNTLTTGSIPYNALANQTQISIGSTPASSSSFELTLTQAGAALTTGAISCPGAYPTAAAIQAAIQALSGYSGATVSGSSGAYTISWGSICNPFTTITANTTTATITPTDSVQAAVNNLYDSEEEYYPFTDMGASGFVTGITFSFGANSPVGSNPSTQTQQQPQFSVASSTLMNSSTVVNTNAVMTTQGVGIGDGTTGVSPVSATCTATGPNFVAAGSINSIASPVAGWSAVYNELDCVDGSNTEDDTQAMQRRANSLSENANGPLDSIIEKVSAVSGVTACIGFQNTTAAAQQVLTFDAAPSSGAFEISVDGQTTSSISGTADAAAVESALQALTGFSDTLVTGDSTFGFVIDWNGSNGSQAVPLAAVVNDTTGESGSIAFGRPPGSFEIVAQGGADTDIANAILSAGPAGINTYGSTTVQVLDQYDNLVNISFSRPTQIPVYVSIALVTDTYNTPGDPSSGVNAQAQWQPSFVGQIQQDILAIGDAIAIGGLIVGFGTNGLVGAFNAVPGIVSYTISFGITANPSSNTNVQLQPEQQGLFEQFNVVVSYT